jgi:hypothetical protein
VLNERDLQERELAVVGDVADLQPPLADHDRLVRLVQLRVELDRGLPGEVEVPPRPGDPVDQRRLPDGHRDISELVAAEGCQLPVERVQLVDREQLLLVGGRVGSHPHGPEVAQSLPELALGLNPAPWG